MIGSEHPGRRLRADARLSFAAISCLHLRRGKLCRRPTKVSHLEENLRGVDIVFNAEELKELNAAVAGVTIRGERLPPAVLAATGVEAPPRR